MLTALLNDVMSGDEIEITRHGRVVARLVPAASTHALRGACADVAMSAAAEEDLYTTGLSWELGR
jgi:prevent-host-death family protein